MIVVMKSNAQPEEVEGVLVRVTGFGLKHSITVGSDQTIIGIIGSPIDTELATALEALPGVEKTLRVSKPYKLASREFHPANTVISVRGIPIGGPELVVMAGPCSVEGEESLLRTAEGVAKAGAKFLRGGAFKPRTSPYAFRGLGEKGLEIMASVRDKTGLALITEVMTPSDVALVGQYTDIFQVGARNMQNYFLLEEVGRTNTPVMLKRGPSGTIEEWLLAAEYIMAQGNHQVILCERGIRTFETATRNTFDLNAVAYAKQVSHLPVIADPSHGTGVWKLVTPVGLGALAAGADGLIVEAHHDVEHAWSDRAQTLSLEHFNELMVGVRALAPALGRVASPVAAH